MCWGCGRYLLAGAFHKVLRPPCVDGVRVRVLRFAGSRDASVSVFIPFSLIRNQISSSFLITVERITRSRLMSGL